MDTEEFPFGVKVKEELFLVNDQLNEIKKESQESEDFLPIITDVTGNALQNEYNINFTIKQEDDYNDEKEISDESPLNVDYNRLKSESFNDAIFKESCVNYAGVGIKEEIEIEPHDFKPLIKDETIYSGDEYCTEMHSFNNSETDTHIYDTNIMNDGLISIKNEVIPMFPRNDYQGRPEVVKIHKVVSKTGKNLMEMEVFTDNKEIIVSEILDNLDYKLNHFEKDVGELLQPLGFHCNICLKKFKSLKTLKKHEETHNLKLSIPNVAMEPIKINKPPKKTLETNMIIDDVTFPCKCGKSYKRLSTVTSCLKKHDSQGLDCDNCSLVFYRKIDLRRHMRTKHNNKIYKYRCKICDRGFSYRLSLRRHTRLHLLDNVNGGDVLDVNNRKIIYCVECGIQFSSVKMLKYHMQIKHSVLIKSENDIAIKKCKDTRKSECKTAQLNNNGTSDLKSSPKEVNRLYLERKTKSRFKNGVNVNEETLKLKIVTGVDERKNEEKSSLKFTFNCRNCGLGYSTLKALMEHKATHNKVKVKFECVRCNDKFTSRGELTSHRRLHCRGGQYPPRQSSYILSKPITTAAKNSSKRTATPTIPNPPCPALPSFACDICSQNFTSKCLMLRHKASHPFVTFAKDDSTHKKIFFK